MRAHTSTPSLMILRRPSAALPLATALRSAAVTALATALTVATLPAQEAPPPSGVVVGQVLDATSGAPLRSVSVRIAELRTVTDEHGRFQVADVPLGDQGALVWRLGYQPVSAIWPIARDTLQVEVSLEPDVLVLEGLTVQVSRLERRLRAAGMAARVHTVDALHGSTARHAQEFLQDRHGLVSVPCHFAAAGRSAECVRVRGAATRPCVIIDDARAPGGFEALRQHRTQDLERVEVYANGRVIVVWTRGYMQFLARSPTNPMPIEAQVQAVC